LDGTFDNLFAIIVALSLEDYFENLTEATVFGPDNNAFASLPQETLDYLSNPDNFDVLQEVIEFHIIEELAPFTELGVGDHVFDTVQGETVTITVSEPDDQGGQLLAANGVPIRTFWLGREAIVYELTEVLIPESVLPLLPSSFQEPGGTASGTYEDSYFLEESGTM